jgi:hypothetical protein
VTPFSEGGEMALRQPRFRSNAGSREAAQAIPVPEEEIALGLLISLAGTPEQFRRFPIGGHAKSPR